MNNAVRSCKITFDDSGSQSSFSSAEEDLFSFRACCHRCAQLGDMADWPLHKWVWAMHICQK